MILCFNCPCVREDSIPPGDQTGFDVKAGRVTRNERYSIPVSSSIETFFKFAVTGLSGVFVNLGSFQLFIGLGVHRLLASPVAIELSILSNFLINNYWTFRDRTMVGGKRIRGMKYHLVSLGTLGLSYGTFLVLNWIWPLVPPVYLQGCAIVPAVLFNYVINSAWTFKANSKEDTPVI